MMFYNDRIWTKRKLQKWCFADLLTLLRAIFWGVWINSKLPYVFCKCGVLQTSCYLKQCNFSVLQFLMDTKICFSVMQKSCKGSGDCKASVGAAWIPLIGSDEIGEIAKGKTSVPSLSSRNRWRLLFLCEAVIGCCILSSGNCHQHYLLLLTQRAARSRMGLLRERGTGLEPPNGKNQFKEKKKPRLVTYSPGPSLCCKEKVSRKIVPAVL